LIFPITTTFTLHIRSPVYLFCRTAR